MHGETVKFTRFVDLHPGIFIAPYVFLQLYVILRCPISQTIDYLGHLFSNRTENVSLLRTYMASVIVLPNVVFPYGFIICLHACVFSTIRVSYYGILLGMCINCE